jgi:formylglycine-generating enzyme required for sulfatase activity
MRRLASAALILAIVLSARPGDKPPDDREVTIHLDSAVTLKMVRVPAGKFWMGGGSGTPGTKEIAVAEFFLGTYEVTQAQWKSVMVTNPSKFKGDDLPVEQVTWNDAQRFIKALNEQAKGKGYTFRLPTEAEWEYACRGAPTTKEDCGFNFYFDKPTNDLSSDEANFDGDRPAGKAAKGKFLATTTKVGSYKPNKLGLYDMHGNVWEWCEDRYAADGPDRMYRGGSFWADGRSCAAWSRLIGKPDEKRIWLGLRLAANAMK